MRRAVRCWLLALGLAMLAPAVAAEVKKWADEQGRTHYGDRPPTGRQDGMTALRGTVSIGDGLTVVPDLDRAAAPKSADKVPTPRRGEVWIYTTPTCGYCRYAMEHMRLKNVPYTAKDITANPKYKAEFRALGGRGVPVTLSGSQRINGYKEAAFEAFLKSAGF